jgi:hypothetical protein
VIEHTGSKESNEGLEKLLCGIEIDETIKQTGKEERNEKENRPFWHAILHKEEWEVNDENYVGKVELKYTFRQQVGITIDTGENEKYGNSSEHLN